MGSKLKEMLLMTRRGLLFLLLVFCSIVYGTCKFVKKHTAKPADTAFKVPKENVYVFPNAVGPVQPSVVPPAQPRVSWRAFEQKNDAALAILLTDTASGWLGLVQGFSNIGIPFTLTTSASEAIKHKVVMVYPIISGKVLRAEDLKAIAEIPAKGGTLIATNIYGGGLGEILEYKDIVPSAKRTRFKLKDGSVIPAINEIFSELIGKEIDIAGKGVTGNLETIGYTGAQNPIITFDDGSACMVYKDHGAGKAYAIGIDLGNFFQRYMNGRGYDPNRGYVNTYDAGMDVFLRIIKHIYQAGEPDAVMLSPVADGKPFTMVITHDIDFTRSIVNAATYADMEKKKGVKATYFIQTKYVRDWNDDIFFNAENVKFLQRIRDDSMEVASHSVAHSKVFSKFEQGTGREQYPQYIPFVKSRLTTYNGTVLGELRISKYLLENFAPGVMVRSFRPGHLQYPFSLPQCLAAVGYRNSTSVTSGTVQTNLPYMLMHNREYEGMTDIVEVPVAVEDELGLPMLQRFDSTVQMANKLAKYGGVLNVLIHTDILGQKFEYEEKLIDRYKDTAWVCTIDGLCNWWRHRRNVQWSVQQIGKSRKLNMVYNGATVNGITMQLPANWKLQPRTTVAKQVGRNVIIDHLNGPVELTFSVR